MCRYWSHTNTKEQSRNTNHQKRRENGFEHEYYHSFRDGYWCGNGRIHQYRRHDIRSRGVKWWYFLTIPREWGVITPRNTQVKRKKIELCGLQRHIPSNCGLPATACLRRVGAHDLSNDLFVWQTTIQSTSTTGISTPSCTIIDDGDEMWKYLSDNYIQKPTKNRKKPQKHTNIFLILYFWVSMKWKKIETDF